jgi:hypothetical protein
MVPRKQAGHMTCTRPQAERQNLLAMRASSTHDPKETFALLFLAEYSTCALQRLDVEPDQGELRQALCQRDTRRSTES